MTSMPDVAPLAGAWIEIVFGMEALILAAVAPLAGAWIEITDPVLTSRCFAVAPLAGAWIEIQPFLPRQYRQLGRSPRGSVD